MGYLTGRRAALLLLAALAVPPAALMLAPPDVRPFADVRAEWRPSEAILLDRGGAELHRLRVDAHGRRLDWTTLEDVSPALSRVVVVAEDRRFWQHPGIDARALMRAVLPGHGSGGASTITMQLAGQLDPTLRPAPRRGIVQKWRQMRAAIALERRWSKREILEAYLNLIAFRGELQGVNAAARVLMERPPAGLDRDQSAVLAALIRSPNAPAERVTRRACALARSIDAAAACDRVGQVVSRALGAGRTPMVDAGIAPHLAAALLTSGGVSVRSTVDGRLQRTVTEILQRELVRLGDRHVQDGAVLVLDNRDGAVLAYAGNGGLQAETRFVDGVRAARQAGSTLKPLLYELALERRILTAASLMDDVPLDVPESGGLYVPENYDHAFRGPVSVRHSLAASLNIPAVRAIALVGPDQFAERLRRLGFSHLSTDAGYYGPSLALGAADVTLWDLTAAYRALATQGTLAEPHAVAGGAHPGRRVMTPEAAYIVADILADRAARSSTFGLDNVLSTRYWSAAKTGTSKDMRDNWCIGFSTRYTVGVWVGNFDGSPMTDVSGVTGAAPVWLEVMNALHRGEPDAPPPEPAGIRRVAVRYAAGEEPARTELFLAGTESPVVSARAGPDASPRIAYPRRDEIVALDPDIPAGHERMLLRAEPWRPGMVMRLGNLRLAAARDGVWWVPERGRFRLVLEDASGRELDAVPFQVRGMR